jgi:type IV pilus assembly protein PilV
VDILPMQMKELQPQMNLKPEIRGFGLMEVLIALLIVSVGFLGVASLNSSYRLAQEALNRQTATTIALNLANRMKLNFVDARLGAGSIYHDPSKNKQVNQNCAPPGVAVCTTSQMAQFDLFQIYTLVSTALPSGSVKVCLDSSATGSCNGSLTNGLAVFSIIVTWSGQNGKTETLISSVMP